VVLSEEFLKDCGTKILIGGWTELNDFLCYARYRLDNLPKINHCFAAGIIILYYSLHVCETLYSNFEEMHVFPHPSP
jgi:hypothetical protein